MLTSNRAVRASALFYGDADAGLCFRSVLVTGNTIRLVDINAARAHARAGTLGFKAIDLRIAVFQRLKKDLLQRIAQSCPLAAGNGITPS